MQWKRLSLCFITCFMFLLSSAHVCFAELDGDALLEDMKQNPSEYLYLYTCTNNETTYIAAYMDRRTVNVHQYEPPHYTIAFTLVYYDKRNDGTCRVHPGTKRYSYDYNTRKAYVETMVSGKYGSSPYWDCINCTYSQPWHKRLMDSADLIFYLAYGMNFFQEPTRLVNDYRKGNPHIFTFTKP